jgi:glycosyltransferase involved in cell wall biosynthesis
MQLSTTLRGGAGIAARRTHEALLSVGVDSTLFTLTTGTSKADRVEVIPRSRLKRLQSVKITVAQSVLIQKSKKLVTPISLTTSSDIIEKSQGFDVVHIHSFYNLLSIREIARIADRIYPKKLFLTLHDQRLLTGGCHYSAACTNFENVCDGCPQATKIGRIFIKKSQQESVRFLSELENLILISPSQWLIEKAKKSFITRDLPCHLIRNPIPNEFFNSASTRTESPITRIGFISANLNNELKGLADLISALNEIDKNLPSYRFEIVFVGLGEVSNLNGTINHKKLNINSDEGMAATLAEIDLVVVPSLEDNLPSAMLESLASGCQVVGSCVGGIQEILEQVGMRTFQPASHAEMVRVLLTSLEHPHNRGKIEFMEHFSYERVARSLVELYST